MRKRNKIIIFSTSALILIGVLVLILFVKKRDKYVLYETDIQGEWVCSLGTEKLNLIFDENICIEEQPQYLSNDDTKSSKYTMEKISDHLYKISTPELHSDYYKYYNMIGYFIKIDTSPIKDKHFNLVIGADEGVKHEFYEDGTGKIYVRTSPTKEEFVETGNGTYYYDNGIIYTGELSVPMYYVMDNGLFDPIYYKK